MYNAQVKRRKDELRVMGRLTILENGDVEAAVDPMPISPVSYDRAMLAIRRAFEPRIDHSRARKNSITFRLSEEVIELLRRLATNLEKSQAGIVELAVRALAKAQKVKSDGKET